MTPDDRTRAVVARMVKRLRAKADRRGEPRFLSAFDVDLGDGPPDARIFVVDLNGIAEAWPRIGSILGALPVYQEPAPELAL